MISDGMKRCLDDLTARIDERQERQNLDAWMAFWQNGGDRGNGSFIPPERTKTPPKIAWPAMKVNDAIDDFDTMLLHQFKTGASDILAAGSSRRMNVRCNYGTGIFPTLFGCNLFMMDHEQDTLPTAISLGSADKVRALLHAGVPDIYGALGGKVFQAAERFLEVFAQYPVLQRHVAFYHPDVQGPIDVAEVVWGSDIFYAFYDETQLLRDFLNLVTETYAVFMRAWYKLVPPSDDYSCHWGLLYKGRLMVRNDSLMNLSPEQYVEFIRPQDQKLFDEFGGGAIHFCGRADHYIEPMSQVRGLTAINLSQPHLNNMDVIYRNTVDKGIRVLDLTREAADSAGRPLRGMVQCF